MGLRVDNGLPGATQQAVKIPSSFLVLWPQSTAHLLVHTSGFVTSLQEGSNQASGVEMISDVLEVLERRVGNPSHFTNEAQIKAVTSLGPTGCLGGITLMP